MKLQRNVFILGSNVGSNLKTYIYGKWVENWREPNTVFELKIDSFISLFLNSESFENLIIKNNPKIYIWLSLGR